METVDSYWSNRFPKIEGWLSEGVLPYIKLVDQVQRNAGISGQLAEIGVYHGKFLIALACLMDIDSKITAIDVFDDQSKNLDGAGEGSLETLKQNISDCGQQEMDYAFIKADSSAFTLAAKVELTVNRGPFRLFSVDGCHTVEHTLGDLQTARDCLADGGVIILDDYMQPHWPGVTQAVSLFCAGAPRAVPFLYSQHKLFFVGVGWHAHFFNSCANEFGHQSSAKRTQMFGYSVLSMYG